jgi:hypothetical protein
VGSLWYVLTGVMQVSCLFHGWCRSLTVTLFQCDDGVRGTARCRLCVYASIMMKIAVSAVNKGVGSIPEGQQQRQQCLMLQRLHQALLHCFAYGVLVVGGVRVTQLLFLGVSRTQFCLMRIYRGIPTALGNGICRLYDDRGVTNLPYWCS